MLFSFSPTIRTMRPRAVLTAVCLAVLLHDHDALAADKTSPHATQPQEFDERKPNVIFILTDDQNNDTLGCFGGKVLTPQIDSLASQGGKFTHAYAVTGICTPSRYTCLTGQYASRCESGQYIIDCPPGTQANVGFNQRGVGVHRAA
jgi:hypothetical protein